MGVSMTLEIARAIILSFVLIFFATFLVIRIRFDIEQSGPQSVGHAWEIWFNRLKYDRYTWVVILLQNKQKNRVKSGIYNLLKFNQGRWAYLIKISYEDPLYHEICEEDFSAIYIFGTKRKGYLNRLLIFFPRIDYLFRFFKFSVFKEIFRILREKGNKSDKVKF